MGIKSELHEAILKRGGKIPPYGGIAAAMDELNKLPGGSGGGVSSWNDLTDKPFGSEIKQGVALDMEKPMFVNDDGAVVLDYPITIFAGEQYAVTNGDGNVYNCTATSIEDPENNASAIILGNIGAMMGEEGTGEPFLVMVTNGMTVMYPLDGTTAVCLTITGLTEVVETIDEKYLPDSAKTLIVRFAEPEVNTYACDKSFDTILTAINKNMEVKGLFDTTLAASGLSVTMILELVYFNDQCIAFSALDGKGMYRDFTVTADGTVYSSTAGA